MNEREMAGDEPGPTHEVLIAAADLTLGARRALRKAAKDANLDVLTYPPDNDSIAHSLSTVSARAVVLSVTSPWAASLCSTIRSNPAHAHLPIFGVSPTLSDLSFAELFGWGGDELVSVDSVGELVPRLRDLQKNRRAFAPRSRGRALVADDDPQRRAPIVRVLQGSGLEVVVAATPEEVAAALTAPIAIASLTLAMAEPARVQELLRGTGQPIVIISGSPRELGVARSTLPTDARIGLYDAFAPPDNFLFLANEIASASMTDRRAAPRLLHGTRVWVRNAGGERDVVGYTFNMSGGGLFIRTLQPFELGSEVWVEFSPPRSNRRVRMSAQVVWRRPFGPIHAALSPAGIGLRIFNGLGDDWERYQEGCRLLATDLGIAR
jgi:hypothetical protein